MRFAATVFTWDHDRNIYWKRRQPPLGRIIIDDEAISNEELSEDNIDGKLVISKQKVFVYDMAFMSRPVK